MRPSIVLLLLFVISSNGWAEPTPDEEIRILTLVEQLKSPDHQQRSDAMAALKKLGQPAYTLLRQVVAASKSPEQVWRAKEILGTLEEQRLDASMLAATSIQLPEGTMTLGEALQILQQDAHAHFAASDAKLFQQPITLPKSESMPYWEAFDLIAKAASVHLVESNILAIPTLTKLAKPNVPKEPERDPRLIKMAAAMETGDKSIKSLEAELAGQPANRVQLLQALQAAQVRRAAMQQILQSLEQQVAVERQRTAIIQKIYALEYGPAEMVQTVGNLRLSLNPLIKSKGELPLWIAIDPEPNVTVGPIESIQIDDATDAQGHALKAEANIKPPVPFGNIRSTVIVNNGVPIVVNGPVVIRNNGGGNIIINQQGGSQADAKPKPVQSMATLSGFADGSSSLKTIRGSMRVPVTCGKITLLEINRGEAGLMNGYSASQPGIAIGFSQVLRKGTNYFVEFYLNSRSDELDLETSLDSAMPIAAGIIINGQAGQQIPFARAPSSLKQLASRDEIKFTDQNGVPFKLIGQIEYIPVPNTIPNMAYAHVKMTLAPTKPDQGRPSGVKIIGHRMRTVTVPFEFKNPSIGK